MTRGRESWLNVICRWFTLGCRDMVVTPGCVFSRSEILLEAAWLKRRRSRRSCAQVTPGGGATVVLADTGYAWGTLNLYVDVNLLIEPGPVDLIWF